MTVIVPPKVRAEVFAKDPEVIKNTFSTLQIKHPKKKLDLKLGEGETEAISLCLEDGISDFLSDDKRARSVAKMLKLNRIGTLGILLWNVKKGFIKKSECRELVDQLVRNNYFISTELYSKVVELLN